MRKSINAALLVVPVLMLGAGARAESFFQDSAGYAGAGFAKEHFDDDGLFDNGRRDSGDSGIHIFGGFRFNQYLAVEASARDLGEYSAHVDGISYKNEFTASTVGAVGSWPLTNGLSIYGRLGVGVVGLRETIDDGGARFHDDDSGGASSLGAGVEYRPMGMYGLGIRLGWESHFFTVQTKQLVSVGNATFFHREDFNQRIDSYGLDVAYYF